MKPFVQSDAWAIQKKLKAQTFEGRKPHTLVQFRHNGVIAIQFGIRRGSGELGHGHIPKEMKISPRQCREFANCNISVDQYVKILQDKGHIAKPATPKADVAPAKPEEVSRETPPDSN